jgi:putative endonuclease
VGRRAARAGDAALSAPSRDAAAGAPRAHWAEALARAALERRGWTTVAANARVPGGELDLVMQDGASLVFVEVRQRAGAGQGGAAESLVARKRARVRRAAALWLARHGGDDRPVRFDAVLVDGDRLRPRLRLVRDAF